MTHCYGYFGLSSTIFQFADDVVPCPSGLGCCFRGDTCLSNNICHDNSPPNGGFPSGYYVASCSDPTFTNPECAKWCTTIAGPDVVYNYTSQEWACCGLSADGLVSCNRPSDLTFKAPPPANLSTILADDSGTIAKTSLASSTRASPSPIASTSVTESPGSTITVTAGASSPAESDVPVPSDPASKGLSTGSKAGIGVGVAVPVLLIAAIFTLGLFRRRRRAAERNSAVDDSKDNTDYGSRAGNIYTYDPSSSTIHDQQGKQAGVTEKGSRTILPHVEMPNDAASHHGAAPAADRVHTVELPNNRQFAPELRGSHVS